MPCQHCCLLLMLSYSSGEIRPDVAAVCNRCAVFSSKISSRIHDHTRVRESVQFGAFCLLLSAKSVPVQTPRTKQKQQVSYGKPEHYLSLHVHWPCTIACCQLIRSSLRSSLPPAAPQPSSSDCVNTQKQRLRLVT